MNNLEMVNLIHSELNAEHGDSRRADNVLIGILSALVDKVVLENYITMKGWNK
jgi:hypothetical protein